MILKILIIPNPSSMGTHFLATLAKIIGILIYLGIKNYKCCSKIVSKIFLILEILFLFQGYLFSQQILHFSQSILVIHGQGISKKKINNIFNCFKKSFFLFQQQFFQFNAINQHNFKKSSKQRNVYLKSSRISFILYLFITL